MMENLYFFLVIFLCAMVSFSDEPISSPLMYISKY